MLEQLVFDTCAISNEKRRRTAASHPLMLIPDIAECEVRRDSQDGTDNATLSVQLVPALLLSAYSMY
jgi:hypothetical protein